MAAKSMLRRSSRRTRTVIGATLAAGTITGALALGGAAFADTPTTGTTASTNAPGAGTVASAEDDSPISSVEYDAALPFFVAGYTYEDAEALAEQWKTADVYEAKVSAGEKLAAGEALPIAPSGTPTTAEALAAGEGPSAATEPPADATTPFFEAGYTVDDAVALAAVWKSPSAYEAKITAGEKLAAGEALPFAPGAGPSQS